ncbi:MAG TPA: hypothetical protein VN924_24915 [Bryobacteraceae bacterium]|nr:hypothetical protein [Bryobacteraceae bacterium]
MINALLRSYPRRRSVRLLAPLLLLALSPPRLGAQPPTPQAATLLSQSLAALTHGTAVTDAKLQANVNYVAGSDEESGAATLEALGHLDSLVVLNLSGGQRQQVQNGEQAASTGPGGQQQLAALHNSLNPAAWFFPALVIEGLLQDASYSVTYAGLENLNGVSVNHLQAARTLPGQGDAATTALLLQLTAFDLYIDAGTFLPVALNFNTHPGNNALQDFPIGIEFSDYRNSGGVVTPFHVQKLLQRSLLLDISMTSVAINTGLTASDFQIQ